MYVPSTFVVSAIAPYQTVVVSLAAVVAVDLTVTGEAELGIAAHVPDSEATLLCALVGPAPNVPELSIRQPHVLLPSAAGVA